MPRKSCLLVLLCLASSGAPCARAATISALSAEGALDTLAPRIEMLAPEPFAVFYAGELMDFAWRVTESHAPAEATPLQFAIRIDGEVVHVDSLSFASGEVGGLGWLVPATATLDCRWELRSEDAFGNLGARSQGPHAIVVDGTGGDATPPARAELRQNYPNPFNPSTRLRFALPAAADARLSIYDLAGREVARLWDGPRAAGWWEVEWRPFGQASGVYFARLRLDDAVFTRKLVLLK